MAETPGEPRVTNIFIQESILYRPGEASESAILQREGFVIKNNETK